MNLIPKVTIAIPTYNRVEYLKLALDSALAQIYPNIEVIVSNNASTDDTEKLLLSYSNERLVVLNQASNIGMMGNWDACLASATGDFFLLLSDDDMLEKNAIYELVSVFFDEESNDEYFRINNQVGMAWCRSRIINEKSEVLRESRIAPKEEDAFSIISGFFDNNRETFPCCILLRTSDIRQCGGYSTSELSLIADAYIWIMCCIKRGKSRYVDMCLASYRVHQDSGTNIATVDEWLYNNSELARVCISFFQNAGEPLKALLIEELFKKLNSRVAVFLIAKKINQEGWIFVYSIGEYRSLCKKYQINHCFLRILKSIIGLAVNSGCLGLLRDGVRRIFRG